MLENTPPALMEAASAEGMVGGDQRTSADSLLFGYSFEGIHDAPYEPPPAPPPGRALLDDTESHMLENFFNTMGSNHPENNDFLFGSGQQQTGDTHDLGFDWTEELPPIFAGSRTSLPQSSTMPHSMTLGDPGLIGIQNLDDPATTSPEILEAASMLYQNGQANGPDMQDWYHTSSFYGDMRPNQQNSTNAHHPSLGPSNDIAGQNPPVPRKPSYTIENGNIFHTMYEGVAQPATTTPNQEHARKPGGLRWGSDASFIDQNYMAPRHQETEEEVTNNLLQNLECLEPQSSANNTRPTSPIAVRHEPPKKPSKGHNSRTTAQSSSIDNSVEEEIRPRKKTKTKVKDEDYGSEDFEDPSPKNKKGKASSSKNRRLSSAAESPAKRRKSQMGKHIRENLSEEQKRSNHILSEQKRRNLIKQGFDDLCDLVPELLGGGFSKSTMLINAADYLEEIMRGNDELRSQLADLESGGGLGYG